MAQSQSNMKTESERKWMTESERKWVTERQRLLLWAVVGICLFLGVAVTSCLATYAVLDTGASQELRDQLQQLRGAVAELAGRQDNVSLHQVDPDTQARSDFLSQNALLRNDVTKMSAGLDDLKTILSSLSPSLSLPSCRHYGTLGLPSGVFSIDPQDGQPAFPAFCDMDSAGGPWLVFQRRQDGSVNFTRNWADYESGFGDLKAEFWLGLEKLHRLTSAGLTQLRVDMATWEGRTGYALYSTFRVSSSSDHFRLEVHGYSGNAGDDIYYYNTEGLTANGMQFSTIDRDHDLAGGSCAQHFKAGWWYNSCHYAHPNGVYGRQGDEGGQYIKWRSVYDDTKKSLKFMEMKIK